MDYKTLDRRLMEEFCEEVEKMKEPTLSTLRLLADISSVLLCLCHPAMQKHIAERHASPTNSYLQEAEKHNPY